jgi:D-alanyl-lipoteichoic acid acyltransferase DltB (MBOAT superfamily)
MLFNSYIFIFAFLPIVLAVFLVIRARLEVYWAVGFLAFASLFFFGWWRPDYLIILLGSMAVNYGFGRALLSRRYSDRATGAILTIGVSLNLALLGYYKYAGFFVQNANDFFGAGWSIPSILLPIGISFFTFQQIAFLVDARRGAVSKFAPMDYIFFVSFFPQLIAGPIVHHAEIMPQVRKIGARDVYADLAVGMSIFVVGLFKKVVVADTFAVYADAGYGTLDAGMPLDFASAWITTLSYCLQIYFDFSAYSDMAIGLARMFGITLPVNFFSPYKSTNIIEFWRRWHMTLSRFLRDYLYIPLGGNRRGDVIRSVNVATVMLLGGLWHGASWTFVIWGGVHGLLLAVNHAWNSLSMSSATVLKTRVATILAISLTFVAVTIAWVPFRSASFDQMTTMLSILSGLEEGPRGVYLSVKGFLVAQGGGVFGDGASYLSWFKARELWPAALPADYLARSVHPVSIVLIGGLAGVFFVPNTSELFARYAPALGLKNLPMKKSAEIRLLNGWVAMIIAGMFVISVLRLSRVSPFLYFQF